MVRTFRNADLTADSFRSFCSVYVLIGNPCLELLLAFQLFVFLMHLLIDVVVSITTEFLLHVLFAV